MSDLLLKKLQKNLNSIWGQRAQLIDDSGSKPTRDSWKAKTSLLFFFFLFKFIFSSVFKCGISFISKHPPGHVTLADWCPCVNFPISWCRKSSEVTVLVRWFSGRNWRIKLRKAVGHVCFCFFFSLEGVSTHSIRLLVFFCWHLTFLFFNSQPGGRDCTPLRLPEFTWPCCCPILTFVFVRLSSDFGFDEAIFTLTSACCLFFSFPRRGSLRQEVWRAFLVPRKVRNLCPLARLNIVNVVCHIFCETAPFPLTPSDSVCARWNWFQNQFQTSCSLTMASVVDEATNVRFLFFFFFNSKHKGKDAQSFK